MTPNRPGPRTGERSLSRAKDGSGVGQQQGYLRHERRWERKAEPHPEPGAGRPSLLVAGRPEDRVRQQPRRAPRSSRHERRRERSAESGVSRRDKRGRCASVLSFEHGQDKSRTRRSRQATCPDRPLVGRSVRGSVHGGPGAPSGSTWVQSPQRHAGKAHHAHARVPGSHRGRGSGDKRAAHDRSAPALLELKRVAVA